MHRSSRRAPYLTSLLITLSVAACSGGGREAPSAPPAFSDVVATGLLNAREPLPGLVTGGQPTPEQFEALVAAGYTRFISLRPSGEDGAGWEEDRAGEMTFARIPVSGASGLTRANAEALDRLLEEAGSAPTVLYCASSNRVGALLALRAFWLEGATAAEALELGRTAGMTRLETAVQEILRSEG